MSRGAAFNLDYFAVKEHQASSLHWDLRTRYSGKSLLSFVLRFPPNLDPNHPIKAVRVEDHNLDHLFKEWIIPPGRRGSGPTALWDKGLFRMIGEKSIVAQVSQDFIRVEFMGKRLKGGFRLTWSGPRKKDWVFQKEWDDFADPKHFFPNVLTPDKILELQGKRLKPGDDQAPDLFPVL